MTGIYHHDTKSLFEMFMSFFLTSLKQTNNNIVSIGTKHLSSLQALSVLKKQELK